MGIRSYASPAASLVTFHQPTMSVFSIVRFAFVQTARPSLASELVG